MSPEGIAPARDEPKANRGVPEAFRGETKPSGARIGEGRIFASWNQLDEWLRQVEGLRRVA